MQLSGHIGYSLSETMEKTTHRQYLVWCKWFEKEYNNPSRTDFYIMQLTSEVKKMLSKSPNQINPNQFMMEFKQVKGKPKRKLNAQEVSELSKSIWKQRLSKKDKKDERSGN